MTVKSVFKAAVDGGWAWLAVIGMLNSAIGAYYYLRVTVSMYFDKPSGEIRSVGLGGRILEAVLGEVRNQLR